MLATQPPSVMHVAFPAVTVAIMPKHAPRPTRGSACPEELPYVRTCVSQARACMCCMRDAHASAMR